MTRDEALTMALEESAIGPTNNTPTGRDSFLLALAASGFAVVPVEATEKMAAAAVGPSFTQRFAAKSIYAAMIAAAQEDSHE